MGLRPTINPTTFREGSGFLGLYTLHHLKAAVLFWLVVSTHLKNISSNHHLFLRPKKSWTLSPFFWMMTRLDSSSSHNQLHNQPQLTKQWYLPKNSLMITCHPKKNNRNIQQHHPQQHHDTASKGGARLPVINRLVSSNPSCSYSYKFVFGPFILLMMAQISGDHKSIWYYMFRSFQGFLSYIPGAWLALGFPNHQQ